MKEVLRHIAKKIKWFDICALLRVLHDLGYEWGDIFFVANTQQTSAVGLCEAIEFNEFAYPKVLITVNCGLLSACSPLPSFFKKHIDSSSIDSVSFLRFLSFFDHYSVQGFFQSSFPEKNSGLFPQWRVTQNHYLSLLGLESISTLWFFMKLLFPEVSVKVSKTLKMKKLKNSSFTIGKHSLGSSFPLGEQKAPLFSSFTIELSGEEENNHLPIPSSWEMKKRVKQCILPLFSSLNPHLTLVLSILDKRKPLYLRLETQLGYERIGTSPYPFRVLIFRGFIKEIDLES